MFSYLMRRLLIMIPTLLVISFLVFIIIQLPPGDFLSNKMAELQSQGDQAALDKIAFMRQQYGLDRPFLEQYLVWVGLWPGIDGFNGMLQGYMGHSFEYDMAVSEVVGERLWLTVLVSVTTIVFTYVVSFPIGVYSAVRQYSVGDHVLTFVGFLGLATPNFLLALVLLYLANRYFGTEIGGLMDERYIGQPWTWGKLGSIIEHLLVPTIVIGTSGTAGMIRRLRANLLDELQKQYVVTGRAKGLSSTRLLLKYPLRMALNPFIADIGNILPHVISGAAIVSVVLSLPTTGPMLLTALGSQDQFLAGSFLMQLAFLTVIGMFLSDVALAALDPRIRLGAGGTR
jgi:peptide/nickel transport system permease protein